MSKPVRLMGDLGGRPVWLDDYESDDPCGATLPDNWLMLSEALIDGPAWGTVALRPTHSNRLKDLINLLRDEAHYRGIDLPSPMPDAPQLLWAEVMAGQIDRTGASRARWFRR